MLGWCKALISGLVKSAIVPQTSVGVRDLILLGWPHSVLRLVLSHRRCLQCCTGFPNSAAAAVERLSGCCSGEEFCFSAAGTQVPRDHLRAARQGSLVPSSQVVGFCMNDSGRVLMQALEVFNNVYNKMSVLRP